MLTKYAYFIFRMIFVASLWLISGLDVADAANYECGAAGQVQGCRICRQTLGSGGNLANHWADDSARCAAGQACVSGACVGGQPPLPPVYDATVVKSGDTAIVKDSAEINFFRKRLHSNLRDAIAATPDHGSLYIGAGVYDGLRADQNIPINNVSPDRKRIITPRFLAGEKIHIYGAVWSNRSQAWR